MKLSLDQEGTTFLKPHLRRTAVSVAAVAFLMVGYVLGIDLLFLTAFILLTILAFSYFFGFWMLHPLSLEVIISPETTEGQETTLLYRLANNGRLPRYMLELKVFSHPDVEAIDCTYLLFGQILPNQTVEIPLRIRFKRRGLYRIGHGLLLAQDPFGLFVAKRLIASESELIVYPMPKPVLLSPFGAERLTHLEETTDKPLSPFSRGDEFWGVREYRWGDELNRIHWKVTAHRNTLSVVETVPHQSKEAFLLIDRHIKAHRSLGEKTTLDELVQIAAFLVRRWIIDGWQVSFLAPPDPPVNAHNNWHIIWRLLALMDAKTFEIPELPSVSQGLILTTQFSPLLPKFHQAQLYGWKVWKLLNEGDGKKDA